MSKYVNRSEVSYVGVASASQTLLTRLFTFVYIMRFFFPPAFQCWFGRNVTCDVRGSWRPTLTTMGVCHTYTLSKSYYNFNFFFLILYLVSQQTSCGVNRSSLSKLFILQNFMNINETKLFLFFFIPSGFCRVSEASNIDCFKNCIWKF